MCLRVDPRTFMWMLLLLCGDIEENPGPMLCGVCGGRCNGRGPKCNVCECWVHLKCSGMMRTRFYGLEGANEERWVCGSCDGSVVSLNAANARTVEREVPGENEVCLVCRVRFRRGHSGVSCADCETRAHKKCSGMSRHELEHDAVWKCERCRTVTTDDVRSEQVATNEMCSVCKMRLRRGQAGVSCSGCEASVHKKCCGLNRWELTRGVEWNCGRCGEQVENAQHDDQENVTTAMTETRNACEELPAGKCDKCRRLRRRGQGIVCRSCGKLMHVGCADQGSRTQAARVDRNDWACSECVSQRVRVEMRERAARMTGRLCGSGVASEGLPSIRVAQWNCDHLQAKIPELEVWLRKHDVDVAMIQESKLREEDGEVRVRGYEMVRCDRWRGGRSRWSRGGGLVTLVRNGWKYRVLSSGVPADGAIEALCVQVMDGNGGVWKLVNVYIPPEGRVHVGEDELRALTGGGCGRWVVCGDFNAHHVDWDERVRQDRRGVMLRNWADERELVLMNDGAVTRVERGSGGPPSTPDVAFCSRELSSLMRWNVLRELGSDHYPILLSFGERVTREKEPHVFVWDWKRADWTGYAVDIKEQLLKHDWKSMNVTEMDAAFCDIVLNAARRYVKMKRLRMSEEEVLSETVREAMMRRDAARSAEVDDEELTAANVEVRSLLREEKERRWRGLLKKGASHDEMWKVVNGVSRRLGVARRKGEALLHDGRVLVSAKAKADAFVKVYEKVSRVHVPRESRMKKRLNACLRSEGPEPEDSVPITLEEVEAALTALDGGRAAGPDGVHPRLLKELPKEALAIVQLLFERSFREARVPQSWRVGEVVPLLKAGKNPSEIGSFRPVCLTACMSKWFERVIASRLRWMLEKNGWLSACQAGFRAGMSVNDQLVRLSQCIWDGYELREKTGLVLYDFARAFDRVWRDGLLWKLSDCGVSSTYVRWVQAWLSNRIVWVKVDGVRSRRRLFRQGLPQGAVLSPLLFLVYVNDLVMRLSERVEVSAFADDLAVWKTSKNVNVCRRELQWASDEVVSWCEQWLMTVAVEKCSVTLFSQDRRDAEMRDLSVRMYGNELKREKLPCFLGITYDIALRFQEQVDKVVSKAKRGVKVLRRLCGSDWGWSKSLLRVTGIALVRAVLLYGSAAWAPWVSNTLWERVERVQLEAARVIGGTLKSAPREAVWAEAGLCPVRRVAESLWMDELEKCLRAPEGSLRRVWGLKVMRKRLVRKGWRERASALLRELLPDGVLRQPVVFGDAPWNAWKGVCWDVDGNKSENVNDCKEDALARLKKWDEADVCVYTDGSAVDSVRLGGAGMVATRGDVENPEVIEERMRVAGGITSSYQAELFALWEAMLWLTENRTMWQSALVVSDSQSGLKALRNAGSSRGEELLMKIVAAGRMLGADGKLLTFVWVPGHCGLAGNEWADEVAKRAVSGDQTDCECLYKTVKCLWKRRERVMEWQHPRCREIYGEGVRFDVEKEWSREDAVSMARLRSGHSLELRGYRCRIGLESDGLCPMCEEDDESVEHVVRCDAGARMRASLNFNWLSDFCCRPREAIELWRWWRRTRLRVA